MTIWQNTATLDHAADVQVSWQSCWQAESVIRPSLSLGSSDASYSVVSQWLLLLHQAAEPVTSGGLEL